MGINNWTIIDSKLVRKEETPAGDIYDSIDKWKFLSKNYTPDIFIDFVNTCSLCVAYLVDICEGCPIYEYKGQVPDCSGTPYERFWGNHLRAITYHVEEREKYIEEGRRLAAEEVKFLRKVARWMEAGNAATR